MPPCPCGLPTDYAACCGPRHDGRRPAETPEALMRSRYSAFALARGDYLVATHDVPARPGAAAELAASARAVVWLGLTVHEAPLPAADEGFVSFTARSLEGGFVSAMSERSRFVRREGRWLYADGSPSVTRAKAGRNEPCPCGSGTKFKQCHG